jgi:Spy/CpxP family protein refolding chaperone
MTESNPPLQQILPPKRGRCRVFKALALSAVIFVAGGAAGYGASWLWHPPMPPPMGRFDPDPPVGNLVDHLRFELSLTDDQTKQVSQIYQDCRDGLIKIRDGVRPQFKAQYDKLDQQMKKVLNPNQYQRWNERFRNIRDQMLPPPPRGHGGPGPWGRPGGPGGPDGFHPHGPPPDDGGPGRPPGMPPPGAG